MFGGYKALCTFFLLTASPFLLHAQFEFWQQTSGPINVVVADLGVTSTDHIYAATSNGVFVSTDYGDSWTVRGLSGNYVNAIAVNPSNQLFAASQGRGVFRSTDGGLNWALVYGKPVYDLAINVRGDVYAGTDSGLVRTTDNGANWNSPPFALYAPVTALHFSAEGDLYIGTRNASVYRSTDNGFSWFNLNLPSIEINAITTMQDGSVFAGSRFSGIYRRLAAASVWTEQNNGLSSREIRALHVNSHQFIFAATGNGGVFRSLDNGAAWTNFSDGLTSANIFSLASTQNEILFAGSDRKRVFRSRYSSTIGVEPEPASLTRDIHIQSLYPNPVADRATIILRSNNAGPVSITITDALGRMVYRTMLENTAGVSTYEWNVANLPEGWYTVTAKSEKSISTKGFILTR